MISVIDQFVCMKNKGIKFIFVSCQEDDTPLQGFKTPFKCVCVCVCVCAL